jgi:hypothetical protein
MPVRTELKAAIDVMKIAHVHDHRRDTEEFSVASSDAPAYRMRPGLHDAALHRHSEER